MSGLIQQLEANVKSDQKKLREAIHFTWLPWKHPQKPTAECSLCGAVVSNLDAHRDWHVRNVLR